MNVWADNIMIQLIHNGSSWFILLTDDMTILVTKVENTYDKIVYYKVKK